MAFADLAPLSLDFDWTPKSIALAFSIGGNSYPPLHQVDAVTRASDSRYASFTTGTNTLLTFTTTSVLPPGLAIIEYRWDFGDGVIGYGSSVVHMYIAANSNAQVGLNVLMNNGKRFTRHRALNLRPADRIGVGIGVLTSPTGGGPVPLLTSTTLTTTTTRVTQG